MQKALTYDDVLLVPQYSDIESRSEASLTTDLGRGVELELPIIASPMDTVSEADMAGSLGELGESQLFTVTIQLKNRLL